MFLVLFLTGRNLHETIFSGTPKEGKVKHLVFCWNKNGGEKETGFLKGVVWLKSGLKHEEVVEMI